MNNHEKKWTVEMKNMLSTKFLFTLFTSLFLFGCKKQMEEIEEELMDKGKDKVQLFITNLHSVNNSGVTGRVIFKYREGGKFLVHIDAKGLVSGKEHPQHIHSKAECPPASATGEDGLLSLPEGLPFYGEIFIPLDDQLIQLKPAGSGNFPIANPAGIISYLETVELDVLNAAVGEHYPQESSRKGLNLGKRTVVLNGAFVKDGKIVPPETEGAEYNATLPVACGEIREAGEGSYGGGNH